MTVIADGNALFRNALFAVVLVYACAAVLSYLLWRKKSLSAVENGGFCLPVNPNTRRFQKIFFPIEIFAGLWFCLDRFLPDDMLTPKVFLAFVAFVFLLWLLFQKLHLPVKACGAILFFVVAMVPMFYSMVSLSLEVEKARENHTSPWGDPYVVTLPNGERETILLQKDEIPLTTADLTEVPADAIYSMSCEEESSFLAKRMECSQYTPGGSPEAPELSYEILDVSYDFLIEPCIRSYQRPILPRYADSESWEPISISGTDSAWQFYDADGACSHYLAQKGNRLVYIHFYWQVQEDQLEKAMEILFAQTL